ncbi:amidase family protein [Epibacterium ulvae]|uniref:amidase family protein n=1 Tax=Epibacterium ulvae TaxID=1156985 RepID=UPI002492D1CD|nr:amidase family protein [Epibacterium ulvae]
MPKALAPFTPSDHTLSLSQARQFRDQRGAQALTDFVLSRAATDQGNAVLAHSNSVVPQAEGPLAGIPFAVKDNIDCLPFPTTGGSPALLDNQPKADSPAVAKLKAAGAHAPLKLNLHELAFGVTNNNAHFGAVPTPFDTTRVAGGSSGGSASAVACGIVPFALGTDTGGSTRIPAAFCGIVGFRPSTGRYPDGGVLTLSTTRDTIGPMASSVTDIIEVDALICDEIDPVPTIKRPLRIGLFYHKQGLSVSLDVQFQKAVDRLQSEGLVEIVEVDETPFTDLEQNYGHIVVTHEAAKIWTQFCAGVRNQSIEDFAASLGSPQVKAIFDLLPERGLSNEAKVAYEKAIKGLTNLRQAYEQLFVTHSLDLIAMPTVPVPPPLVGDEDMIDTDLGPQPTFPTVVRNASLASLTGAPSLSIPAGTDTTGLPVGFMIETRRNEDRFLLAAGVVLERALQML